MSKLDPRVRTVNLDGVRVVGVGAWHHSYEVVQIAAKNKGLPFGVAWSSSPCESDTDRTRIEIANLMTLSQGDVDWFACLHPSLATILPNAVHLHAPIHPFQQPTVGKVDKLGMFLPPTEKKAIFNQLLAIRAFQKRHPDASLITNLVAYKPVLDWLKLRYELVPWLPRNEYLDLLASCRVSLHASAHESFGYGAVDSLMVGTPVVGSRALAWLPPSWQADHHNDAESVLGVLERVWEAPMVNARDWVLGVAESNNRRVRSVVNEWETRYA